MFINIHVVYENWMTLRLHEDLQRQREREREMSRHYLFIQILIDDYHLYNSSYKYPVWFTCNQQIRKKCFKSGRAVSHPRFNKFKKSKIFMIGPKWVSVHPKLTIWTQMNNFLALFIHYEITSIMWDIYVSKKILVNYWLVSFFNESKNCEC